MGYSHYWNWHPEKMDTLPVLSNDTIEKIGVLLKDGLDLGIIADGYEVSESKVFFNGRGTNGYETFHFNIPIKYSNDMWAFNFVKTNRRPYDKYVLACLILIGEEMYPRMMVTSDGHTTGTFLVDEQIVSAYNLIKGLGLRQEWNCPTMRL